VYRIALRRIGSTLAFAGLGGGDGYAPAALSGDISYFAGVRRYLRSYPLVQITTWEKHSVAEVGFSRKTFPFGFFLRKRVYKFVLQQA